MRKGLVMICAGVMLAPVMAFASQGAPQRICFGRIYDAAHLAQHPKQQVTEIDILVEYAAGNPEHSFPYTVFVKTRGRAGVLRNSGDCGFRDDDGMEVNMPDAGALSGTSLIACSADGDLGSLEIKRLKNGKALLQFAQPGGHLALAGECDGATCSYDLRPGADDKTFLADRLSDSTCAALAKSRK